MYSGMFYLRRRFHAFRQPALPPMGRLGVRGSCTLRRFFAAEQLYFTEKLAKGRLYREICSLLFEITDYNIFRRP